MISVRTVTEPDVEGCLDVLEAVVNEGIWLGAEPPFDREGRRERILAGLQSDYNRHLVAVADEETFVGHLGMEVLPYGVAQFGMCVAPEWRGQGVGRLLVEHSVAEARRLGAHKVSLQVWPHNGAARRLYRRLGFEEEGRLRRHYRRRSGQLWDAIVMGLVLDNESPGSPHADAPDRP